MLERLDIVRVDGDGASCEFDAARNVAGRMQPPRLLEDRPRLGARVAQRTPSISLSVSSSLKTRKEFVRTLPWLLTASDTRVIVSSSGASAMTT
jgi:hypothetical protein